MLTSAPTHLRRAVRASSEPRPLTTPQALGSALRAYRGEISANEAGVRAGNAEAVHQMRVAGRRLQSALGMLAEFARKEADRLKEECNWLIDELSPAREIDVFIGDVLQPILNKSGTPPMALRLQAVCLAERKKAYRRANAALSSPKFRRFLSDLRQMEADAHLATAQDDAADVASRVLSEARRELKAKKQIEELSSSRLHKLRLRTKRMRYSVEIARELLERKGHNPDFRRLSKALSQLQTALGATHDIAVHERMLHDFMVTFAELKHEQAEDFREQLKIFLPKKKKRRRKLLGKASRAYDEFWDVGKCWS
jgi:CHAD domain-containing protein